MKEVNNKEALREEASSEWDISTELLQLLASKHKSPRQMFGVLACCVMRLGGAIEDFYESDDEVEFEA